jgi:phosphatidylserine decarboxylase
MKFATQYAKKHIVCFSLAFVVDLVTIIIVGVLLSSRMPTKMLWPILAAYALLTLPVTAFLLLFFRDPDRKADREKPAGNVMLAPSDGMVTDISQINDPRVGGPAIRVGIFMSVFNVHVNRIPCEATVSNVELKSGEYLDARNLDSSYRNRCCDMTLKVVSHSAFNLPEKIIVRQIAGLIAKQIVCPAQIGETYKSGQRFGMVRFGSRTELIVPASPEPKVMVKPGQQVRTGEDILLMYQGR